MSIPAKNTTPVRAIRQKCLDCSGGKTSEIKECGITECPLHAFRMGTNPNYTRGYSRKKKDVPAE